MEMGESVAIGGLGRELKTVCPFKDDNPLGVDDEEEEEKADDSEEAEEEQDNDGGKLGRNLANTSNGAEGTVGGPYPPPDAEEVERVDTKRKKVKVKVPGTDTIADGIYGFTVAAHHLIPGEAALAPSLLKPFMTKAETVNVKTPKGPKQKKIRKHIGYNVNGAHNGVWLPGNYYIREKTSPIKNTSWSELEENPWCLNYVAAVTKVTGGQFHDAHTQYSEAVKTLLNKIASILMLHECDECKPKEINPPFRIKSRLYNLSSYLRNQLEGEPTAWKSPWFSSDRWRDEAFSTGKPSKKFMAAYAKAEVVDP